MSKSLTQHLKDIGEEKVEFFIDGEPQQVTKTEALARKLYIMAQGGVEHVRVGDQIVEIAHKPSYQVAKSIREFTEGKAQTEPPKKDKKQTKPGQYTSEISRRLNDRLGGRQPEPVNTTVKGK